MDKLHKQKPSLCLAQSKRYFHIKVPPLPPEEPRVDVLVWACLTG